MKELQVRNQQRDRKVETRLLRELAEYLLENLLKLKSYELSIALVSQAKMAEINERYLNHTGSTDVITFDYRTEYDDRDRAELDLAGDVFISVEDAVIQSREFGTDWREEVVRYAVHGVLHLRGYDDLEPVARRKMKREEDRRVRELGAEFVIQRLGR